MVSSDQPQETRFDGDAETRRLRGLIRSLFEEAEADPANGVKQPLHRTGAWDWRGWRIERVICRFR